jgi:hypothetical protein
MFRDDIDVEVGMYARHRHQGTALVLAMIVLIILSALTAGLATLSANSVQIAHSQCQSDVAYRAAESGLEIMRYWLSRFIMPKTTPTGEYLATIVAYLQSDLAAAGVTQIDVHDDGSVPAVSVDTAAGGSFWAQLRMDVNDPSVLRLSVTGAHRQATRTIEVAFHMAPYQHPIFNYGMATRGALQFPRNPTLTGATLGWEADVYVDTPEMVAVDIGGNANFAGDFYLANSEGQLCCSGSLVIAGESGEAAVDNHVFAGAEPVAFPMPETDIFTGYATGPAVNPATMDLTKGLTLTNAIIPAGTNPTFDGSVIIQGILLIESPNIVTFNRNCQLNGIMVGDGNLGTPENSQINFLGNFATGPYPTGPQFDWLASAVGTSILTPRFSVSFTGNFSAIDGVVAAGNLRFAGNANADIHGTLINYGTAPMVVDGNISLAFDRAASTKIPGGFDTHRVLEYEPCSYAMAF